MHQAYYRKWRPATFDQVCGQEHITSVLEYEVANNKTSHAYLFCGTRGTGKTTCAKILAKAINCLSPINGNPCGQCEACKAVENGTATDILEMDAASNNGVEYIREIREEVAYLPAMLKSRVYIIDEVHMLSQSAFNALLKTLEEPPPHVVFILATTEMQKIPATILSRCQRFTFKRIAASVIADRIKYIAGEEGLKLDDDAALRIARIAQGGMRDAISLLELCAGENTEIHESTVFNTLGISGRESVERTVRSVVARDYEGIFREISNIYITSSDLTVFWQDLIEFYRDMLVAKTAKSSSEYLDLTASELDSVKELASGFTKERLLYHSRLLNDAYVQLQKGSSSSRVIAEMTLVRMCDDKLSDSGDALLARISALETAVLSGVSSQAIPKPDSDNIIPMPESNCEKKQEETKYAENSDDEIKAANASPSVLSSIKNWIEIVKQYEQIDTGVAPLLKMAKAYTCGDKIKLHVGDSFSKTILERENVKENLARLISSTAGENYNPENITVEAVKQKDTVSDALSELSDV